MKVTFWVLFGLVLSFNTSANFLGGYDPSAPINEIKLQVQCPYSVAIIPKKADRAKGSNEVALNYVNKDKQVTWNGCPHIDVTIYQITNGNKPSTIGHIITNGTEIWRGRTDANGRLKIALKRRFTPSFVSSAYKMEYRFFAVIRPRGKHVYAELWKNQNSPNAGTAPNESKWITETISFPANSTGWLHPALKLDFGTRRIGTDQDPPSLKKLAWSYAIAALVFEKTPEIRGRMLNIYTGAGAFDWSYKVLGITFASAHIPCKAVGCTFYDSIYIPFVDFHPSLKDIQGIPHEMGHYVQGLPYPRITDWLLAMKNSDWFEGAARFEHNRGHKDELFTSFRFAGIEGTARGFHQIIETHYLGGNQITKYLEHTGLFPIGIYGDSDDHEFTLEEMYQVEGNFGKLFHQAIMGPEGTPGIYRKDNTEYVLADKHVALRWTAINDGRKLVSVIVKYCKANDMKFSEERRIAAQGKILAKKVSFCQEPTYNAMLKQMGVEYQFN